MENLKYVNYSNCQSFFTKICSISDIIGLTCFSWNIKTDAQLDSQCRSFTYYVLRLLIARINHLVMNLSSG